MYKFVILKLQISQDFAGLLFEFFSASLAFSFVITFFCNERNKYLGDFLL